MDKTSSRYPAEKLSAFAFDLLQAAGLDEPHAHAVADTLVEGDLLGHDTHGLALLAPYIRELELGSMARSGRPQTISDRPAALVWDGGRLPGPWLVREAIGVLLPRAREYGCASLVIRRSHHIACLASYLLQATNRGFMLLLASSDPAVASVAPHGGRRAVFTPDPIAVGIPAPGSPILIDISASMRTNGMCARMHQSGQLYDEDCMLDAEGRPSRDPGVLAAAPPGTILPLGGMANGHKGFGLALLVEALTGGLAGFGRADPAEGWGATVFLEMFDTAAFGGAEEFLRQMGWIAGACRSNPPRPGLAGVRMPGDRALALRREQLERGVALHPSIMPHLGECAERYRIALPEPV